MPGVDAGYFRHWCNFRPVPVALISARFLCRAYIRKLNYEDDKGYCDDRAVRNGWPTEDLKSYFQPGPLTVVVIIANLRHVASRNGLFLQYKKCLKTPVYEVILLYIPFITLFSVLTMWLPGYFPYFFLNAFLFHA